jgi:ABC-type transporter MlaC component
MIHAIVLFLVMLIPQGSMAYGNDNSYLPYRSLPNAMDLLETGLFWMQEWTGPENASDPASIITLMEERAARHFDFAHIARQVAGIHYTSMNIMDRAHFQNRLRDKLFRELARRFGFFNRRPPTMRPLFPLRTGSNTAMMGTLVRHPGANNVRIYFHFFWSPRGWRIYDVSSNGTKVSTHLRRLFLNNQLDL